MGCTHLHSATCGIVRHFQRSDKNRGIVRGKKIGMGVLGEKLIFWKKWEKIVEILRVSIQCHQLSEMKHSIINKKYSIIVFERIEH